MITPSEGQELAIKFAIDHKYSIIDMPPGQGKTLCAVEVARRLKLNTLVICPSYGKNVWLKEFSRQVPDLEIVCFKKGKEIYPLWDNGVAILSYHLILDRQNTQDKTGRADKLFEWADLVVLDESHNIKESDNVRTQAIHKMIYENRVKYVMMLSGTPAKNRIYELYSPIAICQYRKDNSPFLEKYPTWVHFANEFSHREYVVIRTKRGNIPQTVYKGTKNMDKLKPILDECYFKLPEKYLHKLPPKVYYNIEMESMSDSEELMSAFQDFMDDSRGVMPNIKAKAALATSKMSGQLARDLILKFEAVAVFTDHVAAAISIAENLSITLGMTIEPIHGEVALAKREKILEDFQNGFRPVIVATTGTLSTAVSLARANAMVINDPPWVPGDLLQLENRICRRGQDKTSFYYRVMASKQSERIYEVLEEKSRDLKVVADMMLGEEDVF
jgi:SNF2 family DNA or RNA helicase